MAAPLKRWKRRMRLAGWTIIALFFATVAALALKLSYDVATYVDEPELMEPGQSFATADYIISEVLFTAADVKFYAYRWGSEQPFRIVVLRPARTASRNVSPARRSTAGSSRRRRCITARRWNTRLPRSRRIGRCSS